MKKECHIDMSIVSRSSDNELERLESGFKSCSKYEEETVSESNESNEKSENNSNSTNTTNDSSEIRIDLNGLSSIKINQLKRLKKFIKLSHAYSIHYYSLSRFWKYTYWTSNIVGIILSAITLIVNTFFDPCSNEEVVRKYNVVLGAIITASLGMITVLNAQLRQREFEDAGDEYKVLAQEIYRDVFFSNLSFEDINLAHLISIFSIKFEGYTKNFREPSATKIDTIMNSDIYDLGIKFIL